MNAKDLAHLALSLRRPRTATGLVLPELARELAPVRPDAARLAAFRRITDYPDDGRLPLTYPQVAAFPAQFALLADPRCTVPTMGLIQVGMQIAQHRPIAPAEAWSAKIRLANGRGTPRGFELDVVTTVRVAAEPVWEGTANLLVRGKPAGRQRERQGDGRRMDLEVPPAEVGETTWDIAPQTVREYARVSGDLNPIHLSALTARLLGMPHAVAHGMWSLTRLTGTALDLLGERELTLACAFKLPLFVPGRARARVWTDGGVRQLRLLDDSGTRPHVVASLVQRRPAETGVLD